MGLLRGALLASCAALALAAGTGKKVERQQCTAADAMVLKPFPHAHFKSWGHCEHISLGTVKLEGGELTFEHPEVNTSTFNLQLQRGGELSASGVLDAPDFRSPSCNVSSCQMKGMLGDLDAAMRASDALLNESLAAVASVVDAIVAQGSTISQQHDQLSSLETTVVAQGAAISGQAATISSLQMTVAASSMTMAVQDEKIFALQGQVAAILAQLSVLNSTYES